MAGSEAAIVDCRDSTNIPINILQNYSEAPVEWPPAPIAPLLRIHTSLPFDHTFLAPTFAAPSSFTYRYPLFRSSLSFPPRIFAVLPLSFRFRVSLLLGSVCVLLSGIIPLCL